MPVKETALVVAPLHNDWLAGCATEGMGLIVMLNTFAGPWHPLAFGLTVMPAVAGDEPLLNTVYDGILPVPPAGIPSVAGAVLVHVYTVPDTAPLKATGFVCPPLHNCWFGGCTTLGVGFTVNVNDSGLPVQPAALGTMVMVAVTGLLPVFTALNAGILLLPMAGKPIDGLLFVQVNTVPATFPVNTTGLVMALLHRTWLAGCTTEGVGLTLMVKLWGLPVQPVALGTTVMVAVTGTRLLLVAVKEGISPLPLPASPIDVLLLVQTNNVLATLPVKLMAEVDAPLHTD